MQPQRRRPSNFPYIRWLAVLGLAFVLTVVATGRAILAGAGR
ncbi:MAG: hypothetical protein RMI89_08940 [Gloeomargarita sp. SKYBB_i_bin120]|nr:hypothetical protein [Gloeomargarita sp. SKYB120]MDW8178644.1 hypothetical protein [Gloeomargarita sp. SKYBB_i_bin120]